MDRDSVREIARISNQLDSLERTLELVRTSTVLCFTTMDRSAEDTVSIEFKHSLSEEEGESDMNRILWKAKEGMAEYLSGKIDELNGKIDKILDENA
jgi:galactokinase/mevalonate kinase-like predicted kinase